jgi:hypothetical protein
MQVSNTQKLEIDYINQKASKIKLFNSPLKKLHMLTTQ